MRWSRAHRSCLPSVPVLGKVRQEGLRLAQEQPDLQFQLLRRSDILLSLSLAPALEKGQGWNPSFPLLPKADWDTEAANGLQPPGIRVDVLSCLPCPKASGSERSTVGLESWAAPPGSREPWWGFSLTRRSPQASPWGCLRGGRQRPSPLTSSLHQALLGLRAAHGGIRNWHCLKFMKI